MPPYRSSDIINTVDITDFVNIVAALTGTNHETVFDAIQVIIKSRGRKRRAILNAGYAILYEDGYLFLERYRTKLVILRLF